MTMPTIDVVAAILCIDQKVLIGKRMQGDSNAGRWEFPGGKIKSGEDDEIALKREIKEELGIEISKFTLFDEVFFQYPRYNVSISFYLVNLPTNTKVHRITHDELKWIDPKEHTKFDFLEANRPILERLAVLFS